MSLEPKRKKPPPPKKILEKEIRRYRGMSGADRRKGDDKGAEYYRGRADGVKQAMDHYEWYRFYHEGGKGKEHERRMRGRLVSPDES